MAFRKRRSFKGSRKFKSRRFKGRRSRPSKTPRIGFRM